MSRPITARALPIREPQPGNRICDRCGIEHGSRDHRACQDCRDVLTYVPRILRDKRSRDL